METLTSEEKAELVRMYERQTVGTENWHLHWLGITYTDGLKYLADTCGAYWLIDAVASYQPSIRKHHPRQVDFQVWRIRKVASGAWVLDAWSDTPGQGESEDGPASVLLARQEIEASDFPEELAPFQFYCEGGVVLLKSER
jgi:hypothetical protein